MRQLTDSQINFFRAISNIQEIVVETTCIQCSSAIAMKDVLYEATYATIYHLMELFDGYGDENVHLDIIDSNSKESLKRGIQMHDVCVDFIQS